MMRIRDEAHRRAIAYHRKLRNKGINRSSLDLVPGIGPKRKRLLIQRFGDLEAISSARPEDLALVPGINLSLARNILDFLLKRHQGKGGVILGD
jgi:excinuclease ABC subunit C